MAGLNTTIFFQSSLYNCKYFSQQAGQLFCSTFTGTSNKAMFQWRFMQLRGPIRQGNFLSLSDSSIPRDFIKVSWVLTMSSDDI